MMSLFIHEMYLHERVLSIKLFGLQCVKISIWKSLKQWYGFFQSVTLWKKDGYISTGAILSEWYRRHKNDLYELQISKW